MSGIQHVAVFAKGGSSARDAHADRLRMAWDEEAWKKLLAHTEPLRFRAGDVVIQRGTHDGALFLVASGSLEVGASAEGPAPIARVGVGSVIGEQSFFDGQPRSMNVWAVNDGELLRLTHDAFERFGQEHPALARDLLIALGRVLSLRLRAASAR